MTKISYTIRVSEDGRDWIDFDELPYETLGTAKKIFSVLKSSSKRKYRLIQLKNEITESIINS